METTKITPKVFIDRVLGGTAIGIIVGLIPNAVLAAILKMFGTNPFAVHLGQAAGGHFRYPGRVRPQRYADGH